jgi:hypothetical protein
MSVKTFAETVKEGVTRYTRQFGIELAEAEEAQIAAEVKVEKERAEASEVLEAGTGIEVAGKKVAVSPSVVTDSSGTPHGINSTGVAAGQGMLYDSASGRWLPNPAFLYAPMPTGVAATDAANLTAFINAINATTTGCRAALPPGVYGGAGMTALPAITVPCHLSGAVAGIPGTLAGTVLKFAAKVHGLQIQGAVSLVSDIYQLSASNSLGTDDGLSLTGHGSTAERVICDGFGRDGFSIDTSSSGNANNSAIGPGCRAVNNYRHGYYSAGTNSNVITLTGPDASSNGGWGYYTAAAQCIFIAPHAALNTLGAYYDGGSSNHYIDYYSESGTGNNITAAGVYAKFDTGQYGSPVITDNLTPGAKNRFHPPLGWNVAANSAFLSSWADVVGAGCRPAGVEKDVTGNIRLFGLITGGASGTPAFQIPGNYVPAYTHYFPPGLTSGPAGFYVRSDGYVIVLQSGESKNVSLDGASWPVGG